MERRGMNAIRPKSLSSRFRKLAPDQKEVGNMSFGHSGVRESLAVVDPEPVKPFLVEGELCSLRLGCTIRAPAL
jgi:hypothetical protein